ncbi:MAG: GNAT family N-acetyltransferase [Rhodospirillales bacterium]|nr:GNAT family N-acetyltransferase [Alphaproteobacteria bacterium]USO04404.1 MAG: GNAT family N-acetyltransferase [Rhodospirillales bacterium]
MAEALRVQPAGAPQPGHQLVRPLQKSDYPDWLPVWKANCLHRVSQDVTSETWRRICSPEEQVFALGAWKDEKLVGILHYVLHPTTGSLTPACYMQDLYILENCRRQGLASHLVARLSCTGNAQNWARIYWLAERSNFAAQAFYKNLGVKLDFTLHLLPMQGNRI